MDDLHALVACLLAWYDDVGIRYSIEDVIVYDPDAPDLRLVTTKEAA